MQGCRHFSHSSQNPVGWPCLVYSDYKGWSCLHHAASEGYTQTMDILLSANPKLLDKTDEDGVWIAFVWKSLSSSKSVILHLFAMTVWSTGLFLQFMSCYVRATGALIAVWRWIIQTSLFNNECRALSPVMYWYTRTVRSMSQRGRDIQLQSSSWWIGEQSSP